MDENKFINALNHYYYGTSLWELKQMKGDSCMDGLSYNSFLYLNVIYETPDCTISRLSELLGVSKAAVTMKVNDLVNQGILKKTRSEIDKRVIYLSLSQELSEIYRQYDAYTIRVARSLHEKYTENELNLFCDIMHSLAECEAKGNFL